MGILTRLAGMLGIAVLGLASGLLSAAGTAPTEYQLKAVFLFNFAQFVEWPPEAFPTADTPLAICVLGHDPFGPDLDEVVRGESVRGRPLLVRRHEEAADTAGCHILYLAPGAPDSDVRNALVVTDGAQRGAMIGFVTERRRIRLRIDVAAANEAGLTISSKLLKLAASVGPMERDA